MHNLRCFRLIYLVSNVLSNDLIGLTQQMNRFGVIITTANEGLAK